MRVGPVVLAIDPGRSKCGVAVVSVSRDSGTQAFEVHHREVVSLADLPEALAQLAARFDITSVVLGDGTNSAEIARIAESRQSAPIVIVDEKFSTILARKRFFEENPPRGLRRLIPVSLQIPNCSYDDYVAVILAERYLATSY